ncbi:MAG: CoA-binding protein [Candidatus Anstonellaceae archaeon]
MNEEETIRKILGMKSIAVVGISDNPDRPSFLVSKYLMESGYEIIPVNPGIDSWLGKKSFPDLKSVLQKVEVVDVFRKPAAVPEIVEQAMAIKAKAIWMQEEVVNLEAAKRAEEAGLLVVMDRCMMKERMRLLSHGRL